ncbi:PREDICTED: probable aminopeptidase NPEPL1, partial [Amphimedon queenslandica]|uniref:Probable aminopeptidase NPEPL1 N-terminal domain-containing protein n=2 Tax=Amphimedon queenslandica TaxID=400682 RepID=A0AAN0K131_AMPQE
MAVELQYCLTVPPGDPQQRPVRFIGKLRCLKDLKWPQISDYLSPRVDEQTWSAALESVEKNTTVSLWLSNAIVSALPFKVSRHNSPGRPHALSRTVNTLKLHDHPEYAFIIACERSEAYSLGCAV